MMPGSTAIGEPPCRPDTRARQPARDINWRTGRNMTSKNAVEIPASEVPTRDQVALEDTWDLSGIYPGESDWEADVDRMSALIETVANHRGALGESATRLRQALDDI